MPKIRFFDADVKNNLKGKKLVKKFIEQIFLKEAVPLEGVDYVFCSDEYLLKINTSFLQHDFYTDIITFDLSEGEEVKGEVYISLERVKENASMHQASYQEEVLRVIFHGALHLCGYRDKKKSEIKEMRAKEDYYLRLFEKNEHGSSK